MKREHGTDESQRQYLYGGSSSKVFLGKGGQKYMLTFRQHRAWSQPGIPTSLMNSNDIYSHAVRFLYAL